MTTCTLLCSYALRLLRKLASSSYSRLQRPTRHIIGHFRDDLPSQTLDWYKNFVFPKHHLPGTSKSKQQLQKNNWNTSNKTSLAKLKPGLDTFCVIMARKRIGPIRQLLEPARGSGLTVSSTKILIPWRTKNSSGDEIPKRDTGTKYSLQSVHHRSILLPLWRLTSPTKEFPCRDDLRKFFLTDFITQ